MARSVRAPSGAPSPPGPRDPELRIPLRLTVTRGALGLELYEGFELGPLRVERLDVTLPNLKFPVDLSGGVRVFRHRRGRLERLVVGVETGRLAKWLETRLRESLGGLTRPVSVWRVPHGLGVGFVGARGAVAFDVLWAPVEGDARFVVARARGAALEGPALGAALHAVDTAIGGFAEREGRAFTAPRAAATIVRQVMPAIGARAPSADVRAGDVDGRGDAVHVELDAAFPPLGVAKAVMSAVELADLVRDADEQLARGNLESARASYVAALERAPRHPEISRLIADIDVHAGGRAEASLSVLSDALDPAEAGAVGAALLSRIGDVDGARAALRGATHDEEYGPIAALLWAELAGYETDARSKLIALDEAVARAPGLTSTRLLRFEARLSIGDVRGALADAEHLEASVTGSAARHEMTRACAERLLANGFQRDAGRLFERSLRYVPDDPAATAGLGRALVEAGRTERAVALFERAIESGERRGEPQGDALLDLAKILAKAGDLPQAIARVRQIASPSARLAEARALEGGWREKLGDLAGATLAYGRMREVIELAPPADTKRAVDFLMEAARFEWESRKDATLAERHLAVALRLSPRDRKLGDEYRKIAAIVAARARAPGDE
ncbi:MAG TPA: tetratricopeptide repeat protein [Polyangiaceae bacterium]|nr:tetratricopeptide repeat protein [Polyangiaceae bacterium]